MRLPVRVHDDVAVANVISIASRTPEQAIDFAVVAVGIIVGEKIILTVIAVQLVTTSSAKNIISAGIALQIVICAETENDIIASAAENMVNGRSTVDSGIVLALLRSKYISRIGRRYLVRCIRRNGKRRINVEKL